MHTGEITSRIAAYIHVSESEVSALYPDYEAEWEKTSPDLLQIALFDLGLDVNQHYDLHEVSQHRNRMNKVVTCARWYGQERLDKDWINSGYASKAAKDKVKNCKLLDELYRQKGLTEDAQQAAEMKDFYRSKAAEE